jgi:hypothetical protein
MMIFGESPLDDEGKEYQETIQQQFSFLIEYGQGML